MIELKNVTKTFNMTNTSEDLRIALNNVNLTIQDGEFVTIIGGNGSGKSTTLNILSGFMKPDRGQVLLNGQDITGMKEHQRAEFFGRVFQDPLIGTCGDMSVIENLELAYRRGIKHSPFKWGFSPENKQMFIDELSKFDLGLETRLNQKVKFMSGGQRQALTLLMASMRTKPSHKKIRKIYSNAPHLSHEEALKEFDEAYNLALKDFNENKAKIKADSSLSPKERREKNKENYSVFDTRIRKFDISKQILLLDEHTAALDPKTAKKVLELTNKIVRENGLTTLMVTHNMRDALTYGDRLIMFHCGNIILDVSGEEKNKLTVEDLLRKFEVADLEVEKE